MRRLILFAVLALSPLLSAAAWALDIVDGVGRKVTINAPVNRVIINFNFEEFTAVAGIQGWDKVVGMSRTAWESWRPANYTRFKAVVPKIADVPDVGLIEDNTFSAEKVIALKPDVFLVAEWLFNTLGADRERIEAAGIPIVVIDYNAQILERHIASTRALGKIMGADGRAEELIEYYVRNYRDVLDRIAKAKRTQKPRVYVETGQGGADALGISYATTMWGKLITLLDGENIAVGKLAGASGQLNPEFVIAANPDVIFIAGSSWGNRPKAVKTGYLTDAATTRASLEPYMKRTGWENTGAVKTGNVNAIEHGLCRTLFDFVAMQYIAKRLYPEAFADVDPENSMREYHRKFLPVEYSGTWFLPLKP